MQRKANITKLLPQIAFLFPFTPYFLLFALGSFLAYGWLKSKPLIPDTPVFEIFTLLLKVTVVFGFMILGFAFITVLISWIYLLIQKKRNEVVFKIRSSVKYDNYLEIELKPVLRPLFGFIKFRLIYNEEEYSPKFQLTELEKERPLLNTSLKGNYKWDLPEIKEYKIDKAIVFVEDIFQFFSFALYLDTFERFSSVPKNLDVEVQKVSPKKTENIISRIDVIKKVEGEYMNYKTFENDDIRRIVWKIYAKNKELVVRTPEGVDPYSSHIYLFASFFAGFDISNNETVQVPFLNHYKTMVWSIYTELKKFNPNVRFISDQSDKYILSSDIDSDAKLKHLISVSDWQKHTNLKSYLHDSHPSIVIISSLNNAHVIEGIMAKADRDTIFIFVPLSEALQTQKALDWLEFIFVKADKNKTSKYKTQWALSPLKNRILDNEKKIKSILGTKD